MKRLFAVLAPLTALGLLEAAVACSTSPSTTDKTTVIGPNAGDFTASIGGVGPVFERHCGSFDCHGNPSRAMRIYSQNGLRIPNEAGVLPGGATTTPAEVTANYYSIIAVEPEQMSAAVASKDPNAPYTLLILKKPLNIETHKGGPVMNKGDDPEKCISSWILGTTDKNACTNGAVLP